MKFKRILLLFVLCICLSVYLFSHGKDEHDQQLFSLFYSDASEWNIDQKYIEALKSAAWFALDDYKGNTSDASIQKYLSSLDRIKVPDIPNIGQLVVPGGSSHQKHTHMGWDTLKYTDSPYYPLYAANGAVTQKDFVYHKKVLINTVAKCFNFSEFDKKRAMDKIALEERLVTGQIHYDNVGFLQKLNLNTISKTESMAAIIYYFHVLGDIEGDKLSTGHTRASFETALSEIKKYAGALVGNRKIDSMFKNQTITEASQLIKMFSIGFSALLVESGIDFVDGSISKSKK